MYSHLADEYPEKEISLAIKSQWPDSPPTITSYAPESRSITVYFENPDNWLEACNMNTIRYEYVSTKTGEGAFDRIKTIAHLSATNHPQYCALEISNLPATISNTQTLNGALNHLFKGEAFKDKFKFAHLQLLHPSNRP